MSDLAHTRSAPSGRRAPPPRPRRPACRASIMAGSSQGPGIGPVRRERQRRPGDAAHDELALRGRCSTRPARKAVGQGRWRIRTSGVRPSAMEWRAADHGSVSGWRYVVPSKAEIVRSDSMGPRRVPRRWRRRRARRAVASCQGRTRTVCDGSGGGISSRGAITRPLPLGLWRRSATVAPPEPPIIREARRLSRVPGGGDRFLERR